MKLQERHNEFAVKCFARYMTRQQVADAFIQEFAHDLPQPPPEPKFNRHESNQTYQTEKQAHIDKYMIDLQQEYQKIHGEDAEKHFQEDFQQLQQELSVEYEKAFPQDVKKERTDQLNEHEMQVKEHYKKLKKELSNQLRRFNIAHTQFPEKYRQLFNQAREEFMLNYRSENLQNIDNALSELETIYCHVKQNMFLQTTPSESLRNADLAHNILKTIITCHAVTTKKKELEDQQEEPKQLTE